MKPTRRDEIDKAVVETRLTKPARQDEIDGFAVDTFFKGMPVGLLFRAIQIAAVIGLVFAAKSALGY